LQYPELACEIREIKNYASKRELGVVDFMAGKNEKKKKAN